MDETIEHIRIDYQGKNKNKNYLVGVFCQLRPENKEKLKWVQKLDNLLSTVRTTQSETIIIAGDTNMDCNKPSTVVEKQKDVIHTFNL